MTAFTAAQRAELVDSFARSRIEAQDESRRLAAENAKQRTAEKRVARKVRKQRKAAVVQPARSVMPFPPPSVDIEVVLAAKDLSTAERYVFDRVYGACEREFSTVDVVTHAALIAKTAVAARRAS